MMMMRIIMVLSICLTGLISTYGFDSFHGTKPVKKLNYDSLFTEAVPLDNSPEGQKLIEKCIERYGGEEKLNDLESFKLQYKMKAFLSTDSLDIIKSFQRGRKYKIYRTNKFTTEQRTLNGGRSWFQNSDTLIILDSGRYRAELFSYLTLTMPFGMINERFDDIRYGRRENDSLDYIYMEKQDTLKIILGIDPDDHLIKSSEGMVMQGESNFVFINYFSDFHDHDGYTFPHHITNVSMGLEVAKSILTNIEINPKFEESEFLPNKSLGKMGSY